MYFARLSALALSFAVFRESSASADLKDRNPSRYQGFGRRRILNNLENFIHGVVQRDNTKRAAQGICEQDEYWSVISGLSSGAAFCASFLGIPDATITVTSTLPPSAVVTVTATIDVTRTNVFTSLVTATSTKFITYTGDVAPTTTPAPPVKRGADIADAVLSVVNGDSPADATTADGGLFLSISSVCTCLNPDPAATSTVTEMIPGEVRPIGAFEQDFITVNNTMYQTLTTVTTITVFPNNPVPTANPIISDVTAVGTPMSSTTSPPAQVTGPAISCPADHNTTYTNQVGIYFISYQVYCDIMFVDSGLPGGETTASSASDCAGICSYSDTSIDTTNPDPVCNAWSYSSANSTCYTMHSTSTPISMPGAISAVLYRISFNTNSTLPTNPLPAGSSSILVPSVTTPSETCTTDYSTYYSTIFTQSDGGVGWSWTQGFAEECTWWSQYNYTYETIFYTATTIDLSFATTIVSGGSGSGSGQGGIFSSAAGAGTTRFTIVSGTTFYTADRTFWAVSEGSTIFYSAGENGEDSTFTPSAGASGSAGLPASTPPPTSAQVTSGAISGSAISGQLAISTGAAGGGWSNSTGNGQNGVGSGQNYTVVTIIVNGVTTIVTYTGGMGGVFGNGTGTGGASINFVPPVTAESNFTSVVFKSTPVVETSVLIVTGITGTTWGTGGAGFINGTTVTETLLGATGSRSTRGFSITGLPRTGSLEENSTSVGFGGYGNGSAPIETGTGSNMNTFSISSPPRTGGPQSSSSSPDMSSNSSIITVSSLKSLIYTPLTSYNTPINYTTGLPTPSYNVSSILGFSSSLLPQHTPPTNQTSGFPTASSNLSSTFSFSNSDRPRSGRESSTASVRIHRTSVWGTGSSGFPTPSSNFSLHYPPYGQPPSSAGTSDTICPCATAPISCTPASISIATITTTITVGCESCETPTASSSPQYAEETPSTVSFLGLSSASSGGLPEPSMSVSTPGPSVAPPPIPTMSRRLPGQIASSDQISAACADLDNNIVANPGFEDADVAWAVTLASPDISFGYHISNDQHTPGGIYEGQVLSNSSTAEIRFSQPLTLCPRSSYHVTAFPRQNSDLSECIVVLSIGDSSIIVDQPGTSYNQADGIYVSGQSAADVSVDLVFDVSCLGSDVSPATPAIFDVDDVSVVLAVSG